MVNFCLQYKYLLKHPRTNSIACMKYPRAFYYFNLEETFALIHESQLFEILIGYR